jgi:predicted DNA-binding protein (UPF0251 family)
MPRPKLQKNLSHAPRVTYYKPQGIPMRDLETITLSHEEHEAIVLVDARDMSQTDAATEMGTSQSTLQRILSSARSKLARAIEAGAAIRIEE